MLWVRLARTRDGMCFTSLPIVSSFYPLPRGGELMNGIIDLEEAFPLVYVELLRLLPRLTGSSGTSI
jgi:hypothetical protein